MWIVQNNMNYSLYALCCCLVLKIDGWLKITSLNMIVTLLRIKLRSEPHMYRAGKTFLNFWEAYMKSKITFSQNLLMIKKTF